MLDTRVFLDFYCERRHSPYFIVIWQRFDDVAWATKFAAMSMTLLKKCLPYNPSGVLRNLASHERCRLTGCLVAIWVQWLVWSLTRDGARGGGGAKGATAPASWNLSPPAGEKLTIRRGIFTDQLIYTMYKLSVVVIDLAKQDNGLFSSREI